MSESATEVLRKLLDERGVEWWPMHDDKAGYRDDRDTEFLVYGCKHVAHEWGCRLQVDMLTPEQAIAATLGSGTCEFIPFADEDWDEPNAVRGVCSKCSAPMYGKDNYCPNCGKAVKR